MNKLIKLRLTQIAINKYRTYKKVKKYKGDNVLCPICSSSFKMFAPYGIIKRENAKCHNCRSLERHRLLFLYINEKFNLLNNNSKEKIRLLHFAPEKIFYDIFSTNKGIEYTACDLSPENFNYNGKIEITKVDITQIPFEDNFFDFIICSHVLEHIPDDRLAMSELYRVLAKNGNSILHVPIDYNRDETYEDHNITSPKDRLNAFGQNDHVRIYGKDYKTRLKNSGFIVNEVDYISTMDKVDVFKYGLLTKELIYHCRK